MSEEIAEVVTVPPTKEETSEHASKSEQTESKSEHFLAQFGEIQTIGFSDLIGAWKNYDSEKTGSVAVPSAKGEGEETTDGEGEGIKSEFHKLVGDLSEMMFSEKKDEDTAKSIAQTMMDKLQSTLTDGKVTLKNLMASLPVGESELIKLIQKSQLSEEEVDQMFEQYDSDKTGFISEEEMESLIKDMLKKATGGDEEVVDSLIADHKAELLSLVDKDEDGKISKEEVLQLVKMLLK